MDLWVIFLFIVLFFLSAFFSGSEIALMSIPSHKIKLLVKTKRFWSSALKYIKERNDSLLITILIWNNLVNVYTAALATTLTIEAASGLWLEQSLAIWISTWIVTLFLLLFGEILPKSIATKNAETISLWVAGFYKALMVLLTPINFVIGKLIIVFSWKWWVQSVSDEEIEAFIDMWKDEGTLDPAEHEKLKKILEFGDTLVSSIMVPRVNIEALDSSVTVE